MRVAVECWENQRYVIFKGWGHYRLPTDRPSWSDKSGKQRVYRESFLLPIGWTWATDWMVEPNEGNQEGWYYAADFTVPTRFCSSHPNALSIARRRKWIRFRDLLEHTAQVSWVHSTWCGVQSYGFVGATTAEQQSEQTRQHNGMYHFCSLIEPCCEDSTVPTSAPITASELHYVYKYGIPQVLRRQLWLRWSGSAARRAERADWYRSLSDTAAVTKESEDLQEIMQDVVRTAPRHPYFDGKGSPGAVRLQNVLMCLTLSDSTPPYHQAFSYIVAILLLNAGPEDSFWLMLSLVEDILPFGYHEQFHIRDDLRIVTEFVCEYLPEIDKHFHAKQIDLAVFASGWIQGLYCAHLSFPTACRLLDIMYSERSSTILVRFLIAFLKVHKDTILTMQGTGCLGQWANEWARTVADISDILAVCEKDGLSKKVLTRRDEIMMTRPLD